MKLTFNIKTMHTCLDGFQIYACTQKGKDSIFLDSSKKESPYSQYSIIGVNPFLTVKYEGKKIYIKNYQQASETFVEVEDADDIFQYLNKCLIDYKIDNRTDLPFVGGALGYFSYDLGGEVESIVFKSPDLVEIPDVYFVFYDNAIVIDHRKNTVNITGLGILSDSVSSVNALSDKIDRCVISKNDSFGVNDPSPETKNSIFQSPFDAHLYREAVEKMREYIREGHIYIANMTHTFKAAFTKDSLVTYKKLREINPAPFSAYLPLDEFTILSSSPERFIEIREGKLQTRPIKGTRPRGKTETLDQENKEALLASEKDKSELLMIVDLERNDLSKVCIPGSVKVTELFKIETYATVFHLVATVVGELMPGKTTIDCIKALFPGGSITGAPKYRAMEIIDELEKNKRNIYTGSIGYLGFDGNADLNIVIRTVLIKDDYAYIGVGGGVTWESDSMEEYTETLDKARALFKSLDADYIE